MILIFLRILFGAALGYTLYQAWQNGQANLERGDILNAYYVAVSVGLAVLNAIVWAPFIGGKLSDPLTGTITKSTYVERPNYFLRFIQWLDNRGLRRATRWLCFIEGIRRPLQPTQFILGLNNARAGSWLEKVFAREVFRFNNVQNCIQAYQVLRRHGIDPRPHTNTEVNIVLMSLEREPRPRPEMLVLPKATTPVRPQRNPKIKLFDGVPVQQYESKTDSTRVDAASPPTDGRHTGEGALGGSPRASAPHMVWLQQLWARIWRFIETH